MLFPQPTEKIIDEPIEPVADACTACGAASVGRYTLVDYRGWLAVTKCRSCLHVLESKRIQPPAQAR